ncbi:MAG: hypothetical protein GYB68_15935 [Chloroflexi bacterium]|nr:hypothetical protein [Chloroflexota bacterium]
MIAHRPAWLSNLVDTISAWDGVTLAAHRYGGIEFNLDRVEIGHVHRHGMVDILYSKAIREQLVQEGKAALHHLLPDTGWISYFIRETNDLEGALWLLRLAYVWKHHKAQRHYPKRQPLDLMAELHQLQVSDDIKRLMAD